MKSAEELCQKGFYGVPAEEIPKNQKASIAENRDIEIVTKESVFQVQATRNPNAFVQTEIGREPAYVRATNQKFMSYVTKDRFRFNKPEYYFIFHELIASTEKECNCTDVRQKLDIQAKNFSYFVKKLVSLGLVERMGSSRLRLTEQRAPEKETKLREVVAPQVLLKNVPLYRQILDLIRANEEGVGSQQIKDVFGIDSKQALYALKKVQEDPSEDIVIIMEFEGKIRRNKYILRRYNEQQKNKMLEKIGMSSSAPETDTVNTEARTKVIEELVLQKKATIYNKEFHQSLSDALGIKHVVDKHTMERTANASKTIGIVKVFIKCPQKTITRNVFKDRSIPDDDPAVIDAILKEGHKNFSLVTAWGVVDFSAPEPAELDAYADQASQESSRLSGCRKYFQSVLFTQYEHFYSSVENGYLPEKKARVCALFQFWAEHCKVVPSSFAAIDALSLPVFFNVFSVSEPGLLRQIKEFYQEKKEDWRGLSYAYFRSTAPISLTRYTVSKSHTKTLSGYIDEMVKMHLLVPVPGETSMYTVSTEASLSPFESGEKPLDSEQRDELYQRMCRDADARIQKEDVHADATIKQVYLGVAVQAIRTYSVSLHTKRNLLQLFGKKTFSGKGYFSIYEPVQKVFQYSKDLVLFRQAHSMPKVMCLVKDIKTSLHKKGKIDFLGEYLEEDYFLLECLVLSLESMGAVSIPWPCTQTSSICGAPVSMHPEYKKRFKEKLGCVNTFGIAHAFDTPLSEESVEYFNRFFLFRHILHRGSSSVASIIEKLSFLFPFEIEEVVLTNPSIFVYHPPGTHLSMQTVISLNNFLNPGMPGQSL
ncbi:hypothetical protein NECID01_1840 [Nematocida sp. AWRm77]|nr:hypothetical protein NECID01_1840 [Nematocida sp. AWRm77]